jgi:hypothetical protein
MLEPRAQLVVSQSLLGVVDLIEPSRAGALQATLSNERHDVVQLASVEERAVAATDVDDGARNAAKVHTVHHAPATDARAVADRGGCGRTVPWLDPCQQCRLRILLGAQPFEDVRVHPDAVTRGALQEADRPDSTPSSCLLQPGQGFATVSPALRVRRAPHLWQNTVPANPRAKQDGQLIVAKRARQ